MKLILSLLTVSCLALLLTGTATAHADTFAFTATGEFPSFLGSGSGTLTAVADPTIANAFDVTGISGTVDGNPIVGLLPCATYDPSNPCLSTGNSFFYDNLLYPDGVPPLGLLVLDSRGIGLDLGGGLESSYFASSSHIISFMTNGPHDNGNPVGFSITAIPEPGSFVLLGTGLLGIAGTVRRRIES
jgi:hypothetical protein